MASVTKNQFRKQIPNVLEALHTEVKPAGIKEKSFRRERVKADFWFFFKHYLPHYAEDAAPDFHKEIIDILESGQKFTAIAAPRGFAKSTVVSFAYVIWKVLTEQSKFTVLVSATDDLAENLADFIRIEFTDNRRILEDFGQLMIDTGEAGDFIVGKTRILARGRKQAVRGFRNRQHRPDLIILDDIEKDEEASSPKVVKNILNLILSGLVPSLDPKTGRFVMIGTLLRARSAAGTVLTSEDTPYNGWTRKIYRALNTDTEGNEYSLWEARFSLENLQSLRANMGTGSFNKEYQNLPADDDVTLFNPTWFIEAEADPTAPMAVFIDPSPDGIKKNDYKAAVFVSKAADRLIIEDAVLVQGQDSKFFGPLLDLYQKYQGRILAIQGESNGFQGYFLKDLMAAAQQRGLVLPLQSKKSTLNKEMRIARLAGFFETGKLCFAANAKSTKWGKTLIEQLEYFPTSGIHDDGPDALAGAVELLEQVTNSSGGVTILPRVMRQIFGGRR